MFIVAYCVFFYAPQSTESAGLKLHQFVNSDRNVIFGLAIPFISEISENTLEKWCWSFLSDIASIFHKQLHSM